MPLTNSDNVSCAANPITTARTPLLAKTVFAKSEKALISNKQL